MGVPQNTGRTEGWLYTIRSNRIGLQFSSKRYFVLQDHCLKCFKTIPLSYDEEPVRSAKVDSCVRVTGNGRESINRKVFFIFTVYSTLNHNDKLKLGARSSEEAAEWIHSLQIALTKECPDPSKDFVAVSKKKWPLLRLCVKKTVNSERSIDYCSKLHTESMTSDVIAPSPWKIFGCQNGLRFFKEAKDWDSRGKHWDNNPAVMGVCVIDGTSEAIFQTLISLGSLRSEWDYCFYRGSLVEHLDGHTDIIHLQLYSDWFPRGMKPRDLLLRRYWRREDDGTYVILFQSVIHKKCPPQEGYIRASLKSGGYVMTPINQGTKSLVKHMLAVDWKCWRFYVRPSSERSITIRVIERLAALRELFRAKAGSYSDWSAGELSRQNTLPQVGNVKMNDKAETPEKNDEHGTSTEDGAGRLSGLNNAADEFFDVPNANDVVDGDPEKERLSSGTDTPSMIPPRLSSAANIVKKLHDFAVQKKGYMDLQELTGENSTLCSYGATLQKDASFTLPCSWSPADPSTFLIRGENYFRDNSKVKAKNTLMQMVGADWLRSNKREDDLGSRPDGMVQVLAHARKYASQCRPEFFFIVNIQVPGPSNQTLALYYMLTTPLEETPLLQKFVNGDNAFRNSRFKLIPYISKGSWIVKQSVGKKACLVGQALEVNYFSGNNYLELQIDAGSSTIARGVVSLVLGYLNNLVVEMAFLIQGETKEELPEVLIGTCRLNQLDASKSVLVS